VACANVGSTVTSHYVWQGKRERSAEVPVYFKTLAKNYETVETRIIDLHSYELPFVGAWPVTQVLPGYLNWVKDSVKAA